MGLRYSCDGCGNMLPEGVAPVEVGTVMKRQYCEPCGTLANRYFKEIGDLHTAIALNWQEKLEAIRHRYTQVEPISLKLLPDAS